MAHDMVIDLTSLFEASSLPEEEKAVILKRMADRLSNRIVAPRWAELQKRRPAKARAAKRQP
jgi:hypothetical protein